MKKEFFDTLEKKVKCIGMHAILKTPPHTLDNCVPCCYQCNGSKSDRSERDFLDWIDKVYNFQRAK